MSFYEATEIRSFRTKWNLEGEKKMSKEVKMITCK